MLVGEAQNRLSLAEDGVRSIRTRWATPLSAEGKVRPELSLEKQKVESRGKSSRVSVLSRKGAGWRGAIHIQYVFEGGGSYLVLGFCIIIILKVNGNHCPLEHEEREL